MKNHEDVLAIVEKLKKLYPEGLCSLQYPKPYELLFSVRLAAPQPLSPRDWRSMSSMTMSNISPREAQYSSTFQGSLV